MRKRTQATRDRTKKTKKKYCDLFTFANNLPANSSGLLLCLRTPLEALVECFSIDAQRADKPQSPEKNRFMFVEKLSKTCCIQVRVLYNYSDLWCP
jgi:hypothetical protein